MKKVTVIGGGTGTFVVLSGLKQYPLDLGVIVTMMDSGGSTGRLRDQLGVLPPGDLRQCLVALSEAPLLWRRLFLYRFESGDLEGHNFGNIFISALQKVSDNYSQVLETASFVLKTKGEVLPVTFDKTNLCVSYQNGTTIRGENNIEENISETAKIENAFLDPEAKPNEKAIARIKTSDFLIIGPGDLYTSIIPVLLVRGVKDAIQSSSAQVIFNVNLMTKSGQTTNYKASEHIEDLKRYLGKDPDTIIFNNGKIPEELLQWYQEHNENIVVNDLNMSKQSWKIIEENLIDIHRFEKNNFDKITRSILRHDSNKLAQVLKELIL